MGVVHKLLESMGFVRLRDYGLILTADRRVVTTRTVLDDGFGSQIVGWPNGDLAVIELATAPPEPPPRVPPPRPPALAAALAPPVPPQAAIPVAIEAAESTERTEAAEPTEDEWEWEIAVARARAVDATPIRRLAPEPAPVRVNRIAASPTNIPEHPFTQGRPRTILPVPTLPISSAADVQRGFDSMVRTVPQPRRFPKATSRRVA